MWHHYKRLFGFCQEEKNQKTEKKTKKLAKKGLTRRVWGGIMGELSSRGGSERSLKIEQQEKKYKAKASMEISLILEENTTQQK